MRFSLIILISILVASNYTDAQSYYHRYNILDSHELFISQGLGPTLSRTDYDLIGIGFNHQFSAEYFVKDFSGYHLGIRSFLNGLHITGFDNNKVPDEFVTSLFLVGFAPVISLQIDEFWYPYSSIGLAFNWFDPRQIDGLRMPNNRKNKYDKIAADIFINAGIKYRLSKDWLIYFDGSLMINSYDNLDDIDKYEFADFYGTIQFGISYAISFKSDDDADGIVNEWDKCPFTPLGVEVDEFGCPYDDDLDGVPNYLDECPDTPLGVFVDWYGCPVDSDKDGVPDYLDKCPNTPIKVEVDESGCPVDSDKDGVPDYIDLCPETEAGVEVDSTGCVKMESKNQFFQSDVIYFESGSADLDAESRSKLERLSHYMLNYSGILWYIEGHKDNIEKNIFDEEISLTRVKKILDFLILQGVPLEILKVEDRGSRFAIADNNSITGRAKNRRVVIFSVK